MNSSLTKFCNRCEMQKSVNDFHAKAHYCKECNRSRVHAWQVKNRDRINAERRNPKRREQVRYAVAKHHYGVTKKQILEMRRVQQDKCLICSATLEKKFHIDHDHETTAVRGLLCLLCNVGMGSFKDNPTLLRRAAFYLESRSDFDARKVYAA